MEYKVVFINGERLTVNGVQWCNTSDGVSYLKNVNGNVLLQAPNETLLYMLKVDADKSERK